MSCEYCQGDKLLIGIEDDLFGVGAVIEGDELRVYSLYDGCCCAGEEKQRSNPVLSAHRRFRYQDGRPIH